MFSYYTKVVVFTYIALLVLLQVLIGMIGQKISSQTTPCIMMWPLDSWDSQVSRRTG